MHARSKKVKHEGGKHVNWSGQDPKYMTKGKLFHVTKYIYEFMCMENWQVYRIRQLGCRE